MSEMTHRERVLATMRHEEPDRVPLDLGSTLVTGITKKAYINLAKALGEETGEIELCDTIQQLPYLSGNIIERLDVDIRGLIPSFGRKNPKVEDNGDSYSFTDEWLVKWEMPKGSLYFNIVDSPFAAGISEKAIDDLPWPDPTDESLFDGLAEQAKEYYEAGYAIIVENICAGVFEMCCRVRGAEQFYMDMAMNPDIACKLMDKFVDIKIRYYEAAAKIFGEYVQFVREVDDVAGQESLLMSPQMYREMIKSRHKMLFDAQKRCFPEPFYVFLHSDGAIYDIIPDMIEAGVDVLNPVQITAKGMNAEKLKSEYGNDLCFWGGGIDTQHVLPNATCAEVRANVKERVSTFAPGGGFIFGTVHNIQDDVPAENMLAMFEAFDELKHYH
jgi:uroporphyrinogen decarboxylase